MRYVLLWLLLHFVAIGIGWTCDAQGWVTHPAYFWLIGWGGGLIPLLTVSILAEQGVHEHE